VAVPLGLAHKVQIGSKNIGLETMSPCIRHHPQWRRADCLFAWVRAIQLAYDLRANV
jgi:hypothetical protein